MKGIFECAMETAMANLICSQLTTSNPADQNTSVVAEEQYLIKRKFVCVCVCVRVLEALLVVTN